MANVKIVKRHRTTPLDAAERLKGIIQEVRDKHPSLVKRVDWDSSGLGASGTGKGFDARFDIDSQDVRIAVKLGFLARPFKGRVESTIQGKLDGAFPTAAE